MAAIARPNDTPTPIEPVGLRTLIERTLPKCRPASVRHLEQSVHVHRARKGELLFRQGQPVAMTLIMNGYGVFQRTTVSGQLVTVGIANRGEIYGLTAISSTISSVDMVALTECEVATWHGDVLRHLVVTDPDLALAIIDRMALFLNMLTEKLDGFLHQESRRRVMRVLVRHQDLFFSDPPVLTRSHLPGLVGTSREMTGRVLRELEREGTIGRAGRAGLTLLNPARLQAGYGDPPKLK